MHILLIEKRDFDIHEKNSAGEGTFMEKELTTRKISFNINEKRLASPEVDNDDT